MKIELNIVTFPKLFRLKNKTHTGNKMWGNMPVLIDLLISMGFFLKPQNN
jgi:hypothetical protein